MKVIRHLLAFTALLFCFNLSAQEEEMTPKKYENPQWYVIQYVNFKEGKSSDAKKIIKDHFLEADREAGNTGPVMELDLVFGEWDFVVIWHMEEGVEALNWEISPEGVKWIQAFRKQAGSKERATEIMEEFQSYIVATKSEFARKAWD